MSRKFEDIQAALRHGKNEFNIDMKDPRGVVIDDKLYPATGKGIAVTSYRNERTEDGVDYNAGFYIPLENGLQTYTWFDAAGSCGMQLEVPHITLTYKYPKLRYSYGAPHHVNDNQNVFSKTLKHPDEPSNINWEEPKELLKEWSKLPYQGSLVILDDISGNDADWDEFLERRPKYKNTQRYAFGYAVDLSDKALTDDELQEHRQNYKPDTVIGDGVSPQHIIYDYLDYSDYPTPRQHSSEQYHYNVVTEQLSSRKNT
jgi:hypothetical protein